MTSESNETLRMVRETVRRFVREDLVPLEPLIIRREAERGYTDEPLIPPDVEARLKDKAKALGLWGIDVPEEFGGQEMGTLTKMAVVEELKYSMVPFILPPESPNLHLLSTLCKGSQIDKYLHPYARGESRSCLALSEPGAGSDPGGISTRATRRNGKWVLNGAKTWISRAKHADFMILMAKVDGEDGADGKKGMTAFLLDKGTPGVTVTGPIPIIADNAPYSVFLDNVELDDSKLLGEIGQAFEPLKRRLGVRRLEIGARCIGLATRCIDMMIEQARNRSTFGKLLSDRQAVQWMIADSYQEMEMVRYLVYKLAERLDDGADIRLHGAMAKVQSTEMVGRVADRAIQVFGGMGLTKELPLEYISRLARTFRIVEGPSEVHRWTIARDLLKSGRPDVA